MNFALASTTRLRAIPLVLNNALHHPAILAKAIATADVLSGGRAAVGIGAGWLVDDYEALGASYDTAPIRIDRLTEALRIIAMFFAGDRPRGTRTAQRIPDAVPGARRQAGWTVCVR